MKSIIRTLVFFTLLIFSQQSFAQCLQWVSAPPPNPLVLCDLQANSPELWNQPDFQDTITGLKDLAEMPSDLSISVEDICGGATVSFVLLLDLNSDGVRETAITSDHLLTGGRILFNNAADPNYDGTDTLSFDDRPVTFSQKYRFALENVVQGTSLTSRLRWATDAPPSPYVIPSLPLGKHQMLIWTVKKNTETLTRVYEITVTDCKKPTVVCLNGLSVNIMPTGQIQLWATDFLQYAQDNVTPTNLIEIGIRKSGVGTGFPLDSVGHPVNHVIYNCNQIGTQIIELWAKDQYGNADFCETYVIVQDNIGNCGLTVSIEPVNSSFCGDTSGMHAVVYGGTAPYGYLWNTGNTSPFLAAPSPGLYTVTITDANGNTVSSTYVWEAGPGDCAILEGKIYHDADADCAFQANESGLNQFLVAITDNLNNTFYTTSNAQGRYSVNLDPGTYTVTPLPPNNLWLPCQPNYSVTLAPSQTDSVDIPVQALADCPALTVDLSTPLLRRCFVNQYQVAYCNQGTADASDAYVELALDPYLQLVDAQLPYTDLGNNTYRFDLGDLPINTCDQFWLKVLVVCNAPLGLTHCSTAHIYPDVTCSPGNPNWSGAIIQVTGTCEPDSVRFRIKNIGSAAMANQLEYIVLEDIVMLRNGISPPLASGAEMEVTLPANGSTYRLEADQEQWYPGLSHPALAVEGCTTNPAFSTGFVNLFPQNDADPFLDIDCRENIGSYDPNDKQGIPLGAGPEHYIRPGTDIEYMIRFQNTGTDTAFTVVIRDTLSAWLDPATLVAGASSHPYHLEFYGEGPNIKFTFTDIALPDSSSSQNFSQGFVKFRISQRADVPLETDILNRAAIYFDFNDAVLTNTTVHRVGENFLSVATWQPLQPGLDLRVMPNPAVETAILQLDGLRAGAEWQVELTDATGQSVRKSTVNGNQWRFERGSLPAGMYIVRVVSEGRALGTGKIVLR